MYKKYIAVSESLATMLRPAAGVLLLVTVMFGTIFLVAPLSASASTTPKGCFVFTENNQVVGTRHCNAKANDIEADFTHVAGITCVLQFTLGGKPVSTPQNCPPKANDFEVSWIVSPTGSLAMSTCSWTRGGVTLKAPCSITPTPIPPNGFNFSIQPIKAVFWSINGGLIKPLILPPSTGANNIEFRGT